jgi:hypothetical protein
MLIKQRILARIGTGEFDLQFRRWERPRVKVGSELRTAVGVLSVEEVTVVPMTKLTERDAKRAGFGSRAELLAELRAGRAGRVHRIRLRRTGEDPRIALRQNARFSKAERTELEQRLARMDRASSDPWTGAVLALIRDHPGRRAPELAETMGQETRPFKARVRRLKELGLTESLAVGYRLSPRGRAFLRV